MGVKMDIKLTLDKYQVCLLISLLEKEILNDREQGEYKHILKSLRKGL